MGQDQITVTSEDEKKSNQSKTDSQKPQRSRKTPRERLVKSWASLSEEQKAEISGIEKYEDLTKHQEILEKYFRGYFKESEGANGTTRNFLKKIISAFDEFKETFESLQNKPKTEKSELEKDSPKSKEEPKRKRKVVRKETPQERLVKSWASLSEEQKAEISRLEKYEDLMDHQKILETYFQGYFIESKVENETRRSFRTKIIAAFKEFKTKVTELHRQDNPGMLPSDPPSVDSSALSTPDDSLSPKRAGCLNDEPSFVIPPGTSTPAQRRGASAIPSFENSLPRARKSTGSSSKCKRRVAQIVEAPPVVPLNASIRMGREKHSSLSVSSVSSDAENSSSELMVDLLPKLEERKTWVEIGEDSTAVARFDYQWWKVSGSQNDVVALDGVEKNNYPVFLGLLFLDNVFRQSVKMSNNLQIDIHHVMKYKSGEIVVQYSISNTSTGLLVVPKRDFRCPADEGKKIVLLVTDKEIDKDHWGNVKIQSDGGVALTERLNILNKSADVTDSIRVDQLPTRVPEIVEKINNDLDKLDIFNKGYGEFATQEKDQIQQDFRQHLLELEGLSEHYQKLKEIILTSVQNRCLGNHIDGKALKKALREQDPTMVVYNLLEGVLISPPKKMQDRQEIYDSVFKMIKAFQKAEAEHLFKTEVAPGFSKVDDEFKKFSSLMHGLSVLSQFRPSVSFDNPQTLSDCNPRLLLGLQQVIVNLDSTYREFFNKKTPTKNLCEWLSVFQNEYADPTVIGNALLEEIRKLLDHAKQRTLSMLHEQRNAVNAEVNDIDNVRKALQNEFEQSGHTKQYNAKKQQWMSYLENSKHRRDHLAQRAKVLDTQIDFITQWSSEHNNIGLTFLHLMCRLGNISVEVDTERAESESRERRASSFSRYLAKDEFKFSDYVIIRKHEKILLQKMREMFFYRVDQKDSQDAHEYIDSKQRIFLASYDLIILIFRYYLDNPDQKHDGVLQSCYHCFAGVNSLEELWNYIKTLSANPKVATESKVKVQPLYAFLCKQGITDERVAGIQLPHCQRNNNFDLLRKRLSRPFSVFVLNCLCAISSEGYLYGLIPFRQGLAIFDEMVAALQEKQSEPAQNPQPAEQQPQYDLFSLRKKFADLLKKVDAAKKQVEKEINYPAEYHLTEEQKKKFEQAIREKQIRHFRNFQKLNWQLSDSVSELEYELAMAKAKAKAKAQKVSHIDEIVRLVNDEIEFRKKYTHGKDKRKRKNSDRKRLVQGDSDLLKSYSDLASWHIDYNLRGVLRHVRGGNRQRIETLMSLYIEVIKGEKNRIDLLKKLCSVKKVTKGYRSRLIGLLNHDITRIQDSNFTMFKSMVLGQAAMYGQEGCELAKAMQNGVSFDILFGENAKEIDALIVQYLADFAAGHITADPTCEKLIKERYQCERFTSQAESFVLLQAFHFIATTFKHSEDTISFDLFNGHAQSFKRALSYYLHIKRPSIVRSRFIESCIEWLKQQNAYDEACEYMTIMDQIVLEEFSKNIEAWNKELTIEDNMKALGDSVWTFEQHPVVNARREVLTQLKASMNHFIDDKILDAFKIFIDELTDGCVSLSNQEGALNVQEQHSYFWSNKLAAGRYATSRYLQEAVEQALDEFSLTVFNKIAPITTYASAIAKIIFGQETFIRFQTVAYPRATGAVLQPLRTAFLTYLSAACTIDQQFELIEKLYSSSDDSLLGKLFSVEQINTAEPSFKDQVATASVGFMVSLVGNILNKQDMTIISAIAAAQTRCIASIAGDIFSLKNILVAAASSILPYPFDAARCEFLVKAFGEIEAHSLLKFSEEDEQRINSFCTYYFCALCSTALRFTDVVHNEFITKIEVLLDQVAMLSVGDKRFYSTKKMLKEFYENYFDRLSSEEEKREFFRSSPLAEKIVQSILVPELGNGDRLHALLKYGTSEQRSSAHRFIMIQLASMEQGAAINLMELYDAQISYIDPHPFEEEYPDVSDLVFSERQDFWDTVVDALIESRDYDKVARYWLFASASQRERYFNKQQANELARRLEKELKEHRDYFTPPSQEENSQPVFTVAQVILLSYASASSEEAKKKHFLKDVSFIIQYADENEKVALLKQIEDIYKTLKDEFDTIHQSLISKDSIDKTSRISLRSLKNGSVSNVTKPTSERNASDQSRSQVESMENDSDESEKDRARMSAWSRDNIWLLTNLYWRFYLKEKTEVQDPEILAIDMDRVLRDALAALRRYLNADHPLITAEHWSKEEFYAKLSLLERSVIIVKASGNQKMIAEIQDRIAFLYSLYVHKGSKYKVTDSGRFNRLAKVIMMLSDDQTMNVRLEAREIKRKCYSESDNEFVDQCLQDKILEDPFIVFQYRLTKFRDVLGRELGCVARRISKLNDQRIDQVKCLRDFMVEQEIEAFSEIKRVALPSYLKTYYDTVHQDSNLTVITEVSAVMLLALRQSTRISQYVENMQHLYDYFNASLRREGLKTLLGDEQFSCWIEKLHVLCGESRQLSELENMFQLSEPARPLKIKQRQAENLLEVDPVRAAHKLKELTVVGQTLKPTFIPTKFQDATDAVACAEEFEKSVQCSKEVSGAFLKILQALRDEKEEQLFVTLDAQANFDFVIAQKEQETALQICNSCTESNVEEDGQRTLEEAKEAYDEILDLSFVEKSQKQDKGKARKEKIKEELLSKVAAVYRQESGVRIENQVVEAIRQDLCLIAGEMLAECLNQFDVKDTMSLIKVSRNLTDMHRFTYGFFKKYATSEQREAMAKAIVVHVKANFATYVSDARFCEGMIKRFRELLKLANGLNTTAENYSETLPAFAGLTPRVALKNIQETCKHNFEQNAELIVSCFHQVFLHGSITDIVQMFEYFLSFYAGVKADKLVEGLKEIFPQGIKDVIRLYIECILSEEFVLCREEWCDQVREPKDHHDDAQSSTSDEQDVLDDSVSVLGDADDERMSDDLWSTVSDESQAVTHRSTRSSDSDEHYTASMDHSRTQLDRLDPVAKHRGILRRALRDFVADRSNDHTLFYKALTQAINLLQSVEKEGGLGQDILPELESFQKSHLDGAKRIFAKRWANILIEYAQLHLNEERTAELKPRVVSIQRILKIFDPLHVVGFVSDENYKVVLALISWDKLVEPKTFEALTKYLSVPGEITLEDINNILEEDDAIVPSAKKKVSTAYAKIQKASVDARVGMIDELLTSDNREAVVITESHVSELNAIVEDVPGIRPLFFIAYWERLLADYISTRGSKIYYFSVEMFNHLFNALLDQEILDEEEMITQRSKLFPENKTKITFSSANTKLYNYFQELPLEFADKVRSPDKLFFETYWEKLVSKDINTSKGQIYCFSVEMFKLLFDPLLKLEIVTQSERDEMQDKIFTDGATSVSFRSARDDLYDYFKTLSSDVITHVRSPEALFFEIYWERLLSRYINTLKTEVFYFSVGMFKLLFDPLVKLGLIDQKEMDGVRGQIFKNDKTKVPFIFELKRLYEYFTKLDLPKKTRLSSQQFFVAYWESLVRSYVYAPEKTSYHLSEDAFKVLFGALLKCKFIDEKEMQLVHRQIFQNNNTEVLFSSVGIKLYTYFRKQLPSEVLEKMRYPAARKQADNGRGYSSVPGSPRQIGGKLERRVSSPAIATFSARQ